MSKSVDVLAVMEQAACALRIDARYGQGADMDAAYAAVAELIEAAAPAASDEGMGQSEIDRLRAVLACVKGGAA